jgi:hypothetical protein
VLLKPRPVDTNAARLAPLLLLEITKEMPDPSLPGMVFTWKREGRLSGAPVAQVMFAWGYESGSPPDQGVRITLNQDGLPILWEVLRDKTGVRVVYVTQSLEARAMRAFPSPLPGHRYWIEPPPDQSPKTVVARVLDETSVPMGPILYLEAGTADVTTVICRCMDAQAVELVETRTYALVDLDTWAEEDRQALGVGEAFNDHPLDLEDLSEMLRFPD